MDITISSFTPHGHLRIPSSKGYSHRYLIACFLVNKPITLKNVNLCEDVMTTIEALEVLGARFDIQGTTVKYLGRNKVTGDVVINAKESGTTLRMLFPLACYLHKNVKFLGASNLMSRPFKAFREILEKQNIKFEKTDEYIQIHGQLSLSDFTIEGNTSSQFASGLMILNAYAGSKKNITILPPVESKSYIVMTLNVLEEFGFVFETKYNVHRYTGKCSMVSNQFEIEVDYSLLATFAVLAALKGQIKFGTQNDNSLQGDSIILDILNHIGVNVNYDGLGVVVSHHKIYPFDLDISDCFDLYPTMMVLAALIPGQSHFSGIKRLQSKEARRVHTMIDVLNAIGVGTIVNENDIYVNGVEEISGDFSFDSKNDHRIAMALAILGANIHGSLTITDAEAVNKSYPNFYQDLLKLKQ